jgi:hypothetical protein
MRGIPVARIDRDHAVGSERVAERVRRGSGIGDHVGAATVVGRTRAGVEIP